MMYILEYIEVGCSALRCEVCGEPITHLATMMSSGDILCIECAQMMEEEYISMTEEILANVPC